MLPLALVEEIDRQLKERKLSQRKIAAKLGVGRGTVAAIASGRRGLFGKEDDFDELRSLVPRTASARCPQCGFLVYMPCMVCRTRDFRERQRQIRASMTLRNRTRSARSPRRLSVGAARRPRRARVA